MAAAINNVAGEAADGKIGPSQENQHQAADGQNAAQKDQ